MTFLQSIWNLHLKTCEIYECDKCEHVEKTFPVSRSTYIPAKNVIQALLRLTEMMMKKPMKKDMSKSIHEYFPNCKFW